MQIFLDLHLNHGSYPASPHLLRRVPEVSHSLSVEKLASVFMYILLKEVPIEMHVSFIPDSMFYLLDLPTGPLLTTHKY